MTDGTTYALSWPRSIAWAIILTTPFALAAYWSQP